MSITFKIVNHKIVFMINEKDNFDDVLKQLSRLLDSEMFTNISYYPKAFFDFGCRKMEDQEYLAFINFVIKKKKVIFSGSTYQLQNIKTIHYIPREIYAGEYKKEYQKCIFTKKIHQDARVEIYNDTYFLDEVMGTIIIKNDHIKIYGHHFVHAKLYFLHDERQDFTYFGNVEIYYNHNEICINKGAF